MKYVRQHTHAIHACISSITEYFQRYTLEIFAESAANNVIHGPVRTIGNLQACSTVWEISLDSRENRLFFLTRNLTTFLCLCQCQWGDFEMESGEGHFPCQFLCGYRYI